MEKSKENEHKNDDDAAFTPDVRCKTKILFFDWDKTNKTSEIKWIVKSSGSAERTNTNTRYE